ncbi:hypothetical protein [Candidatus Arsenophonus triatominarum]|uniref:hypothetical protein n=1 Tax=Candidatus Arsenophonus triatominarum TaxID=57911 RepID=UPI0007C44895|nr:hypothetical protein [Candidatus Arsenophonus triatominarum]
MLTANTPLLARLAENHTQMVIAHNQLAEAHKMLISQLVGQFENDPSDPNEPTGANKPKSFAPDVKLQPATPVIDEPKEQIKSEPEPVVAEKKVKAPKTETKPKPIEPIVEAPKVEPKPEPVDIESLELREIVALSVLFGNKAVKPDNMQLASARAIPASEKADSTTGQIDALYCALDGISKIKMLSKTSTFDLCLKILANWNNLSGITERREFALPLFKKALRSDASTLITQLVKGRYRNEAVDILTSFNAKKLGDVTDDNLVQFIEKAQSVLADDKSEGSDG